MKKHLLLVLVLLMGIFSLRAQNSCTPPTGLNAHLHAPNWQNVNLTWNPVVDLTEANIQWSTTSYDTKIGADGPFDFTGVIRFEPSDLANYSGRSLTAVSFVPGETQSVCTYSIRVWQGGSYSNNTFTPGTMIVDQLITSPLTVETLNTILLDNPVTIDPTQELWIGIRCNTTAGFPLGASGNGVIANKGELILSDSIWETLTESELTDYNWLIIGTLTEDANILSGYNVYRDNSLLGMVPSTSFLDSVANGTYLYEVTAAYANGCESDPISVSVTMAENPCFNCLDSVIVGTGTSTSYVLPLNTFYNYSYSQQIYTASELGNIDGAIPCISFQYIYTSDQSKNIKVYMGNTSKSTFAGSTDWVPVNDMYLVFDGTIDFIANMSNNWVNIPLDIPFEWDGSSNIVVAVLNNTGDYVSSSSPTFNTHSASSKSLYIQNDSSPYDLSTSLSGTVGSERNNIRFMIGEPVTCPMPSHFTASNITHESAELSWWSRGVEGGYEVVVVPEGSNLSSETPIFVSDTFYTVENLTENTHYTIYMHSICGGENSSWLQVQIHTNCLPVDELPIIEDFESYSTSTLAFPDCWSKIANGSYPYITNTSAGTGTGSLYFYSYTNAPCYAIMPPIDETIDMSSLQIKFKAKNTSSSYGHLEVGVMTDPTDVSTFTSIKTFDGTNYPSTNTWYDFIVYLNNYMGSGKYIAFRSPGDYTSYVYVDNIEVNTISGCGSPTNLTVNHIAGTSALLNWEASELTSASDVYTIEYSEHGMDNWFSASTTDNGQYLLSGLQAETSYDAMLYVSCDNGTSDTSFITFSTSCLANINRTIGNGTTTNTYIPSYSFYSYGYSQQIFKASEVGDAGTLSELSLYLSNLAQQRIYKFYLMHTTASSSATWLPTDSAQLVFEGNQTLTSGWNTFSFTNPFFYNGTDNLALIAIDMTGSYVSGNSWLGHTGDANCSRYAYQDGTAYSINSLPSSGTINSSNFRNNIIFSTCDDEATCVAPNLIINQVTNSSANLIWAPGNMEAAWELEYRLDSDTDWTSLGTQSSTEYYLDNLMSSTTYHIRLRSDCGGEYSNWVVANFTTECDYVTTLPFTENFDSYASSDYPDCWSRNSTYTSYDYPYISSSYAHSGNMGLYMTNGSSSYYTIGALPRFDDSIEMNNLLIGFSTYFTSSSYFVEVGIMSDPANASTFTPLATIHPNNTSTWELQEVMSNSYTGNGQFVAFRMPSGISNYAYMDDIYVDVIPTCPHINNLAVSNIDSADATLTWDAGGDEGEWEIIILPASQAVNVDFDTCSTVFAYSTSYEINNLEPSTQYTAFIRANCDAFDQSTWTSLTFQTLQIPSYLPYTCDFETDQSWSFVNGSCANQWCIGTATNNGGTHAMYISSDNGATNSYNTSSSANVWAYKDIYFPASTNTFVLEFDWKAYGESGYDYISVFYGEPEEPIAGSALVFPSNATQLQPNVNSSYPTYFNMQSTFQHYFIEIAPFTNAGVKRIYFLWHNDGSGGTTPPGAVDNVSVYEATCPAPSNLHVSNTTPSSVEIDWTANPNSTSWNIIYGADGFDPANGGTTINVTSHPYEITNLNTDTYNFYVSTDCGSDGQSALIGPITAAPGSINMPSSGTQTVSICGGHIYDDGGIAGDYSNSCNGTLTINPDAAGMAVQLTGTYDTENSYDILTIYDGTSTGGTVLGTFTNTGNINVTSTTGSLTLHFTSDGSVQYSGFALTVSCVPLSASCDEPTNVQVSPGINTATVTWTPGGTESSWYLQYRTANGSWSSSVTASTPTYTLTNLTASTAYEVRVQANCGGTTSDWANASFTTTSENSCPTPTNFRVESQTNNSVTFAWNQEAGTATEWEINYKANSASAWTNVTVNNNPFTITDLQQDESYQAQIIAHCGNGINSDASPVISFTITGVNDYLLEKGVSLLPNPATNYVDIMVNDNNVILDELYVYDVYGKLLMTISVDSNPTRIDISDLASGMYMVRIFSNNSVVNKSFIKR
ncbi:MAG: fibronectin type III domain-containing protein [Bacteroidales bacterium]|nr:fibronectin type III domain-containing protein [Bacteroidales bacterium]